VGDHYPERGRMPSIRAQEMDLVLLIKSVKVKPNILPLDLHRSKTKLNINSSIDQCIEYTMSL
jgi:hypothetical protein